MSKSRNQVYSDDDINRTNQLNPNNDAYWTSRGYEERPYDWESELLKESGQDNNSSDRT